MRAQRLFIKNAIGASSVTLTPTAAAQEGKPPYLLLSQVVVSTGGATPDAGFWGTTTTDGVMYEITISRKS